MEDADSLRSTNKRRDMFFAFKELKLGTIQLLDKGLTE